MRRAINPATTVTRRDPYRIGDKVEFRGEDPYGIQKRHAEKYGPGPYDVEYVVLATDKNPSHVQIVVINDQPYSGYWFKPLR
jgi:hypothetical protein